MLALLAATLTPGCGGARGTGGGAGVRPPATAEALSAPEYEARFTWFVRPLPTEGTVRLALYFDAGSRDAEPPQAATLAAYALAARIASDDPRRGVDAQVTPDATAFTFTCPASALSECAEQVCAALLEPATLGAGELTAAHRRLREGRNRAQGDAARSAEAAALRALVGRDAAGLFPLGVEEHDAAASAEVVQSFVDANYGSQRALLMAEGDADVHALDELGSRLREAHEAERPRADRQLLTEAGVAVELGHENAAAVALRAHGHAHARAIIDLLRDPAFAGEDPEAPDLAAFELRGGSLVLLSVPSTRLVADPTDTAQRLATLALRASDAADGAPWRDASTAGSRAEDDTTEGASPRHMPGGGSLEALGERWAARPARAASAAADEGATRDAFGLGVALDGGRADALDEDDPDARTRRTAEAALQEALTHAIRRARPWRDAPALASLLSRPGEDTSAYAPEHLWSPVDATLPNGARLRVALSPTGESGVLVAFDGGPGEDGEPLHGRAALAVTALAHRCTRMLGALEGVQVRTRVDADRVGLWFEDGGAGWARVVDVAARCALEQSPDDADLQDAKRSLRAELGSPGSEPRMRVWVAEALSPAQPGRVAPMGSAERLDAVRVGDVQRALERLRVGARAHLVAFAQAPPRRVARRVAPRLAVLAAGEAFEPTRSRTLGDSPHAVAWVGATPDHARLVVAFRDPAGARDGDPDAPSPSALGRAHALALAARLRGAGLPVVWIAGDGSAYGHWSAVAIETTVDTLDSLPARVEAALRADLDLAESLSQLSAPRQRDLREQAQQALAPVARAESGPRTPGTGARYIVARPQPAEAMRRQNGR